MAYGYTLSPVVDVDWRSGMGISVGASNSGGVIDVQWRSGMSCAPSRPTIGGSIEVAWQSAMSVTVPVPRYGTVEVEWVSGMSVSGIVLPGQPANIRALLQDTMATWGFQCCTTPKDCVLAEAVRHVNSAIQQFFLSARASEFLINPKQRDYSFSPSGENAHKFFSPSGVDLPDIGNIDHTAEGNPAWTTRLHHVSRVVWCNRTTGRIHHLRPVHSNPMANVNGSMAMEGNPGSTIMEWLDTPVNPVPLYYEVFRDARNNHQPKIRGYPWTDVNGAGNETVSVTYYNAPEPITVLDFNNGASLDIAQSCLELYIMPLCRHAALSSIYFDAVNAPLAAAIKARYQEVLSFLELGDIQSPALRS